MEPVTSENEEASSLNGVPLAVVLALPEALVVQANDRVSSMLRVDPAALPTSLSMSLVETDWDFMRGTITPQLLAGEPWSGSLQFRDPAGVERRAMALFVPHSDHNGVVERATMLIEAQVTGAAWAGAVDHLTDLPTRPVLIDRLEHALSRAERQPTELAVLFLDVDGLKLINDRYGHETGDEFLRDTAMRLKQCLRLGDTVSRFGGDEFVILCEDLERREVAHDVAARILQSLLHTDGKQAIPASIGIAFASDAPGSAKDLVARADAAMYRAKDRGGRRAEVFDTKMQQRQDDDQALRRRLCQAIADDSLAVAAQPLFELATGTVRGVELFVRFEGQSMQPIGAEDVLRLARERTTAIDEAVLGHALDLASIWRRVLGIRAPRVHVNVSPQTLSLPNLSERLIERVDAQRLGRGVLMIEADQTTVANGEEEHISSLVALRESGFGVAIDGLANGQLPLNLLNRVRPHLVKLDARAHALSARQLVPRGVAVAAKGLETHEEVRQAVAGGVWGGQGQILHDVTAIADVNEALFGGPRLGY